MKALSLLGVLFAFLANVFLGVGDLNMVYVGWSGLDRLHQTHLKEVTSLYQCDNHILDSKDEEDPRYSVISVRPDKTAYLNATGTSIRGLWDYTTSGGDNLIIMADESTVYKSSGSLWTTLEAGFSNNPWEGNLYALPGIERLYLCNGIETNRKFFGGRSRLYNMQNQDDETQIGGTMYFTNNSLTATGDATAIASIEVGQYIKSATTIDDDGWVEVVSIESTTVTFSTLYTGIATNAASCVRSNDMVNSRHMIEFEGHQVLGYTDVSQEVEIDNSTNSGLSGNWYALGNIDGLAYDAYGVAQSFTATSNRISGVSFVVSRGSSNDPVGNIVVKLKDSITSANPLAEVVYPVSALSTTPTLTNFSFGNVVISSGSTYEVTIERETSSTSLFNVFHSSSSYAGGNSYYTYNQDGFNASWNTGLRTFEVTPLSSTANLGAALETDTYIDEANSTTNYEDSVSMYAGNYSSKLRKSLLAFFIDYMFVNYGTSGLGWNRVTISLYKHGTGEGTVGAYQVNSPTVYPQNNFGGTSWDHYFDNALLWQLAGASSPEGDYLSANSTTEVVTSAEGWVTFEVTGMTHTLTTAGFGLCALISAETDSQLSFYQQDNATNKPKWTFTVPRGSTEASVDLAFRVLTDTSDSSTVRYSKRYKPENFPTLNVLTVPGTIVGLAKSGGYLIVGTERPDGLHFYNATYDTTDGFGITDTARKDGMTFGGGSHSIAYLSDGSFIFYSGLGVYLQDGLQTTLKSGKIREEAKELNNYRDPLDYYGGLADIMPQAVIDHVKDTYMLAAPKALGVNSYIYPYNFTNDTWTRWTSLYPTAMLYRKERGTTPTLYMGDTDGQVYTMDKTGSITSEATLVWFFSGKDITKKKQFGLIEMIGRADNPLTDCVVTLEVQNTNPISEDEYTTAVSQTINLSDNTTTDAQVRLLFTDVGLSAREIKLTLSQSSSRGAVAWRAIKYKGSVSEP